MVINAGQCQYAAVIAAAAEPHQRYSKKEENPFDIKRLKHFAASCGTAALVFAGILVLGSGLTAKPQSVDTRSDKRLEGTWRFSSRRDCQTGAALRTFRPCYLRQRGTLSVTTQANSRAKHYRLGRLGHTDGHATARCRSLRF